MTEAIPVQCGDGIGEAQDPIQDQLSPFGFGKLLVLGRFPMVDEGLQGVLTDEVGQGVTESFGSIRSPNGSNMVVLDHLGALDIHDVIFLEGEGRVLVSHCKFSPDVDVVRLLGQVDTRPLLQGDSWRQSHDVLERDLLIVGVVDVQARTQDAQQKGELGLVEAGVGLVVPSVGQCQLLDVVHGQGEVVIIPALLNHGEDPVCFSNVDQDEEQAPRLLQDPFQVGVVGQVPKADGAAEPLTLPRLQARGDKVLVHLLVDALLGPPNLLQLVVGGDEGVAAIAVDEGV